MQETILLFHMEEELKKIITIICAQLGVTVKEIDEKDICQKMGYILEIDGYERLDDHEVSGNMTQEFMFFAGMVQEQLDLLLDVFKSAGLPLIPYKAMLTENNVEYLFHQVYENVAHEYEQLVGKSTSKVN